MRKKIIKLKFILVLGILSLSPNLNADVLLVPQQYSTVQSAIAAASANDTVLVSPGTYYENINFHGKAIVVKGNGTAESIIIDGSQPVYSDSASVVKFCNGEGQSSILDGFTLTGGTGTNTDNGMIGGGIFMFDNAAPQIKNCIIKNNIASLGGAIGQWSSTGLGGEPHISYCTIFNNSAGAYGGGIWLSASNGSITNCTVVKNFASDGSNITLTSFASGVAVSNCIIWDGSIGGFPFLGNYNYCDIQGGWPSGTGNISSDPLFCDPDLDEYQLAVNSPCVDKGEDGTTIGALGVGCDSITTDVSNVFVVPQKYSLYQSYPNPFNPSTTIKYSVPKQSDVTIKVYDVMGSEVATLVNEEKEIGVYKINFNGSNLANGIYFYQIQAGEYIQAKKMILLK